MKTLKIIKRGKNAFEPSSFAVIKNASDTVPKRSGRCPEEKKPQANAFVVNLHDNGIAEITREIFVKILEDKISPTFGIG